MNPHERLAIWQAHLANAQDAFDTAKARHPGIDASLLSSIRNGWRGSVKTATDMIGYYEKKVAALAL